MVTETSGQRHDALIESLLDPASYIHTVRGPIQLHETHISWVVLAGRYAYKIKKPIANDFLDYGTLAKRHHACCEELRLGNRYAVGVYLDVVPISFEDGRFRMDGDAQPIEFAVRMRRFEQDALLSHQLVKNSVTVSSIEELAWTVARLHQDASKLSRHSGIVVSTQRSQSMENFELLLSEPLLRQDTQLQNLERWTVDFFETHRSRFVDRVEQGSVRECHGDLHCNNIVFWNGKWVPFDGIEFNSDLSWIDVISDVAFLVMDLRELGHPDLSAAFLNAYLENTGDYQALGIIRWYLVYRALVRAKVEVLRARQEHEVERLNSSQIEPAMAYIRLANEITEAGKRTLWITHGVSGSGKTTGSQYVVLHSGAIRIRSDIERKRLFKTSPNSQSDNYSSNDMYSPTASEATYSKLLELSRCVLQAGFDIIVDATFLRRANRQRFQELANSEKAEFRIIDFRADEEVLKRRITLRSQIHSDASDATLDVLSSQLLTQEPLATTELEKTIAGNNLESTALLQANR